MRFDLFPHNDFCCREVNRRWVSESVIPDRIMRAIRDVYIKIKSQGNPARQQDCPLQEAP
jgi:hypothetical protein